MIQLKHHLTRALTLPPHILIQKVARKIKGGITKQYQRHQDKLYSTYSDVSIDDGLSHYFSSVDVKQLASMSEMFSGITANYLQHRFDLLGSGWVQVKHGMACRGLEGYCYEMGNSTPIVNPANLQESKLILALIDENYTLIDWHLDFKSGYRWDEATWYQDITYGHKLGVDVKVPWELARMQHLPQMAFQYALTDKKPIYPREFRNQVLDFIAMNPPRFGVNWRCTMDVGIRISNWLVAYDLFCAYGAEFDDAFLSLFKRSVYEHGKHIINNLEWSPDLRSNHYLSDIVGLLYVAAYLPHSKETASWLNFAIDEMIKEVKTQFHPDGSNFEASTSYHRLSGELVIYATLLILSLDKHKQKIPDWYIERLEKIAEFTMDITRPDGLIPQIGDNDSGRFLKLFPVYKKGREYWQEEVLDHRHLVAAINTLFKRQYFTDFADIASIESSICHPDDRRDLKSKQDFSYRRNDNKSEFCHPDDKSTCHPDDKSTCHPDDKSTCHPDDKSTCHPDDRRDLKSKQDPSCRRDDRVMVECRDDRVMVERRADYPDFGLYIYKTKRIYLIVRCGSVGQNGYGGHAHNDQLSFELCVDGVPFLVDPGTYIYTPLPKQRNKFRATASHNTLIVEGKEQNKLEETQLFGLPEKAYAKVIERGEYKIKMEHRGFGKRHQREIAIEPTSETVQICDLYEGKESVMINFNLAPGVNAEIKGQSVLLNNRGRQLRLQADGGEWRSENGVFSGGYGLVEDTVRIQLVGFHNKFNHNFSLNT